MQWQKTFQSKTQAGWESGQYSVVAQLHTDTGRISYVLFYGKTTRNTYPQVLGGYTEPAKAKEAAEQHALLQGQ